MIDSFSAFWLQLGSVASAAACQGRDDMRVGSARFGALIEFDCTCVEQVACCIVGMQSMLRQHPCECECECEIDRVSNWVILCCTCCSDRAVCFGS